MSVARKRWPFWSRTITSEPVSSFWANVRQTSPFTCAKAGAGSINVIAISAATKVLLVMTRTLLEIKAHSTAPRDVADAIAVECRAHVAAHERSFADKPF